jgi:acyl dehydratase
VGDTWISGRRTVTEADIVNFAGISGDFNPLHTDAVFAAGTAFGERVAHGALVLAIATGLRQQMGLFEGTLKALVEIRAWRFVAPVFAGDTLHATTTISAARETTKGDSGLISQRVEVINQRDEVVQHGELVALVRVRGAG